MNIENVIKRILPPLLPVMLAGLLLLPMICASDCVAGNATSVAGTATAGWWSGRAL